MSNLRYNSHSKKRRDKTHGRVNTKIPAPISPVADDLSECVLAEDVVSDGSSYCPSLLEQAYCRCFSLCNKELGNSPCSPCCGKSNKSRPSKHSNESGPTSNYDADGKSSSYAMYHILTIILCCIAMMCFYLMRIQGQSHIHSCKICDDQIVEPKNAKLSKRRGDGVNYASEALGAHVVAHDTRYYMHGGYSLSHLLHLPKLDMASPDIMLQENDACYALQGQAGTFIIHLATPIILDSITLEHDKPECDAAPKEFNIYALKDILDESQISLGKYQYENRGSLVQKFVVPRYDEIGFVGLKIMSNWGNREYTSICNVEVHGKAKP